MKSDDLEYDRTAIARRWTSPIPSRSRRAATVARRPRPIPWQERPAGCRDVVWRHAGNPIIGRHHMPGVQGIYNSAVAPYGDGFVGVFRVEKRCRFPHLHVGWSDDGLDWHIEPEPIQFASGDPGDAGRLRLRSARLQDRRHVLHHLVRRAQRPDDQRRRDARLPDVRAAGERVPAVQSQRRAVPAEDRRQVFACSAGPATTATRRSATSISAKAPTCATGECTGW